MGGVIQENLIRVKKKKNETYYISICFPRRKRNPELADLKFDIMPSNAQEITTKTAPNVEQRQMKSYKFDNSSKIKRIKQMKHIILASASPKEKKEHLKFDIMKSLQKQHQMK